MLGKVYYSISIITTLLLLSACGGDNTNSSNIIINYNNYLEDNEYANELTINYDTTKIVNKEILRGFPLVIDISATVLLSDDSEPYAAFSVYLIPDGEEDFSLQKPLYEIGTFRFDKESHQTDGKWDDDLLATFTLKLPDDISIGAYRVVLISGHALYAAKQDDTQGEGGILTAENLGLNDLEELELLKISENSDSKFDINLSGYYAIQNLQGSVSLDVDLSEEKQMPIHLNTDHLIWGDSPSAIASKPNIVLEVQIKGAWQPMNLIIETDDEVISNKFYEQLNIEEKTQGISGYFSDQQIADLYENFQLAGTVEIDAPLRIALKTSDDQDYSDMNLENNVFKLSPLKINMLSSEAIKLRSGSISTPFSRAKTTTQAYQPGKHSVYDYDYQNHYDINTTLLNMSLGFAQFTSDTSYTLGQTNQPSAEFNSSTQASFEVLGTGIIKAINASIDIKGGLTSKIGWTVNVGGEIPQMDKKGLVFDDNGNVELNDYTLFSSEKWVKEIINEDLTWEVNRDMILAQGSIPVGILPIQYSAGISGDISANMNITANEDGIKINGSPLTADSDAWLNVELDLSRRIINYSSWAVDVRVNLILDAGFNATVHLLNGKTNIDRVGLTFNNTNNIWETGGSFSSSLGMMQAELDVTAQMGAKITKPIKKTFMLIDKKNVSLAKTKGYLISKTLPTFNLN